MFSQKSSQGLDLRGYRRSRCLVIFVFLALPLSATTYYVDNCVVTGNDSNNGASTSTPWLTVNKVNNAANILQPGDSVLFRGGCIWREGLNVPQSGAPGSVITFGAYGSGAKPLFLGSVQPSAWTLYSGSIYSAFFTGTPRNVFQDDAPLIVESSPAGLVAGSYYADTGHNLLYVWTTNGASPSTHVMEVPNPAVAAVLHVSGYAYITFDSLAVRYAYDDAILSGGGNHITINNCETLRSSGGDIWLSGSESWPASYNSVTNNYVHGNAAPNKASAITLSSSDHSTVAGNTLQSSGEAIVISNVTDTVMVTDNTAFTSDSVVISLDALNGNTLQNVTVTRNRITGGGQNGIFVGIETGLTGNAISNTISYNVISNVRLTGGAGILLGAFGGAAGNIQNNKVYGNTIYSASNGIEVAGQEAGVTLTGNDFRNNICYIPDGLCLLYRTGTSPNNTFDYNDYYNTASGNVVGWLGTTYTLAAYQVAASRDTHSISADPKFNNASGGDFTLQAGSPAINTGTDLGSTYQWGLDPRTNFPWGTLNQNGQGSGWEIGAFVFAQGIPPAPPTSLSVTVK